jgi:hypothetical protein
LDDPVAVTLPTQKKATTPSATKTTAVKKVASSPLAKKQPLTKNQKKISPPQKKIEKSKVVQKVSHSQTQPQNKKPQALSHPVASPVAKEVVAPVVL